MRRILTCFSIFLLSLFSLPQGSLYAAQETTYLVLKCHDGDTCHLQGADNIHIKVRLIAIDAPEVGKKNKKPDQPFGPESRDYLNRLIKGKKVTLKNYGLDPFSRNLAEIYLGDLNVNLDMVQKGMAEIYHGKLEKGVDIEKYKKAENTAQKEKKGLWSLNRRQSPQEWRRTHKEK